MSFKDLTEILGAAPAKTLPINGVNVEFPATVSARVGALLLAMQADLRREGGDTDGMVERLALSEGDAAELEDALLGDAAEVLDGMGIIGEARQLVMGTLVAWHLGGVEAAEATWASGGSREKAPARPNRATRRATAGRSSATGGSAAARSRTGSGARSSARMKPATT